MPIEQLQFSTHKHSGIDGTMPITQQDFISVYLMGTSAATAANYGVFFIVPRNCVVKDFYEIHEVAGSDGGAVTLQLERLQGTEAPDSGDDLLTSAISLKGTANTVSRGILSKDNRVVSLKTGDRLRIKDSGTLTAVAGLCATIIIEYTL
jgi:hypothetical protein